MQRRLILERTFGGRYRDKAHAIGVYQQHNQDVAAMVPPERLLQLDIRAGWEPLCTFLDKPVPDKPFPRENERSAFLASAPAWAKKIKQEQNDRKR